MATKKAKERQRQERNRRAGRRRNSQAPNRLITFEIYGEPKETHRPAGVNELADKAMDLISRKDGAGAERLLIQALELDPEACDLQNNLCIAYQIQGRRDEAAALVRQIHDRNPHYLFGRTNLAHLCIMEGDIERAKRLISPLSMQRRLHVTEFSALVAAQIHLGLAQGNVEAARDSFKIWLEVVPGHPMQRHWRRKLARTPLGWLRRTAMLARPTH